MGDGPGYDYVAHETSQAAHRKAARQDIRAAKLQDILLSCGFGEYDGGYMTILEKESFRHLQLAYELLQGIRAGRKGGA